MQFILKSYRITSYPAKKLKAEIVRELLIPCFYAGIEVNEISSELYLKDKKVNRKL